MDDQQRIIDRIGEILSGILSDRYPGVEVKVSFVKGGNDNEEKQCVGASCGAR